jgi:hypothetical protein
MIKLYLIFSLYLGNIYARDWDSSKEQIVAEIMQKKILNEEVLNNSFFCDCHAWDNYLYLKKCSFNIRSLSVVAKIKHIIPISLYADRFPEFKGLNQKCQKHNPPLFGEDCVSLTNKEYINLENDPYNLFIVEPFISQFITGKTLSIKKIKGSYLNACPIIINTQSIYFENPEKTGWLSRLYLYLDQEYPTAKILNDEQRSLYYKISNTYKPNKKECKFTIAINKKYGKINNITTNLCMKQQKGGLHGSK